MKTKVIVLGQEPKEEKKLKPIEFKQVLLATKFMFKDTDAKPNEYENVELICKRYDGKMDLMFTYFNDRDEGVLFLGHFNDGVVE